MIDCSVRMMDHKVYFGKGNISGYHFHYSFDISVAGDIFSGLWLRRYDIILLLSLFAEGDRSFYTVQDGRVYVKFPGGFLSFIELKQSGQVKQLWENDKDFPYLNFHTFLLKKSLLVLSAFGVSMFKLTNGKGQDLIIKSGEQWRYNFIVGKVGNNQKVDIDMTLDIFKKTIDIILSLTDTVTVRQTDGGLQLLWSYNKMGFSLQVAKQVIIVVQ
jgi:hypothetical protein